MSEVEGHAMRFKRRGVGGGVQGGGGYAVAVLGTGEDAAADCRTSPQLQN